MAQTLLITYKKKHFQSTTTNFPQNPYQHFSITLHLPIIGNHHQPFPLVASRPSLPTVRLKASRTRSSCSVPSRRSNKVKSCCAYLPVGFRNAAAVRGVYPKSPWKIPTFPGKYRKHGGCSGAMLVDPGVKKIQKSLRPTNLRFIYKKKYPSMTYPITICTSGFRGVEHTNLGGPCVCPSIRKLQGQCLSMMVQSSFDAGLLNLVLELA